MAGIPPSCLGPLAPSAPRVRLPRGSWDTHFHVLGPQSRFPYAAGRKYSPPDAPFDNLRRLHEALGIDRGLVVHANTHGFDNSVDLDAVERSEGRYYAVVRLDGSITAQSAKRLHSKGARGVRFAFNPQHGGTLDFDVFDHVMGAIEGLGWFVELHFEGTALPELKDWLCSIPAPVVIDHLGRIDPALGLDQEPFAVLSHLAERGNVWIKLSGADRISRTGYPYDDVAPFAARLVEIAANRLLWGSDWPHTGIFDLKRIPDDGQLIDALASFVPAVSIRERILNENPLRLLHLPK